MIPDWLHFLAIASLTLGLVCAAVVVVDVVRHPQHMWIMNLVWPITALFGTVFTLLGYFAYGRLATEQNLGPAMKHGGDPPHKKQTPFPAMVGKGASHCGAGCTLGDLIAEWLAFFVPPVAVWLGWHAIFTEKMFAVWILDYGFALAIGVAFQYFTIVPMRNLSPGQGIVAAFKADILSLTAWQVGMYGFMAVAQFWIFRSLLGTDLQVNTPEFWFMMQIAMVAGFFTSYPVNWFLISTGIKERM